MIPGLKPHHVGWAVADLEPATALFAELGYALEASLPDCLDPNFQVNLRFLSRPGDDVLIELIAPAGPNSSVSALVKRSGPGPYHLGFRAADMDSADAQLRKLGFMPISQLQAAPALGNRMIRFWRHQSLGLIELILWP